MVKRGAEEFIMNQLSSLQKKNKMLIFLNVTTKCSTSKPGHSEWHVMIRLKSLSDILWTWKLCLISWKRQKTSDEYFNIRAFIRFSIKFRELKGISTLISGPGADNADELFFFIPSGSQLVPEDQEWCLNLLGLPYEIPQTAWLKQQKNFLSHF